MVGPDVLQLHVPNSWVYPGGQLLVSHNGGVLDPGFLFQVNHIIAVRSELLAAISCDPLPAFFLEGRGKSLGLFSCALLRPSGGHVKGRRPGLQLLAIGSPATVDADGVGDQLAVLIPSLLNVCHSPSSPYKHPGTRHTLFAGTGL